MFFWTFRELRSIAGDVPTTPHSILIVTEYVSDHLFPAFIEVVDMDYGMKDKNPIDHVHFYSKTDYSQAKKITKNEVTT